MADLRLVKRTGSEREAAYWAALRLVQLIEQHLDAGTQHYRNRAGVLLRTPDQVERAILAGDLVIGGINDNRADTARAA